MFEDIEIRFEITFIEESVDSVDGGTFVVASQKEEVFGVFNLVSHQKTDRFQGLFASVHIVTHK